MRIAFLLCLVVPALAFGQQSITLNLNSGGQTAIFENASQCNDLITVNWSATVAGIACQPFQVFATTAASCPAGGPTGSDFTIGTQSDFSSKSSSFFTLRTNELPIFDGGTCPTAIDEVVTICGTYKVASLGCNTDAQSIQASPVTVRFDAIPPGPPVVTAVNTLDGALGVRVDPGSDTSTVTVQYRPLDGGTFINVSPYSAQNGGTTIDNLVNGTTYEVRATVSDQANNESQPSAVKTGTPAPTQGFWGNYVGDGGHESGGCNAVGPSSVALLLIAAAFARARRKS